VSVEVERRLDRGMAQVPHNVVLLQPQIDQQGHASVSKIAKA